MPRFPELRATQQDQDSVGWWRKVAKLVTKEKKKGFNTLIGMAALETWECLCIRRGQPEHEWFSSLI